MHAQGPMDCRTDLQHLFSPSGAHIHSESHIHAIALMDKEWPLRDKPRVIKSPRPLSAHTSMLQRHTISQITEHFKKFIALIDQ